MLALIILIKLVLLFQTTSGQFIKFDKCSNIQPPADFDLSLLFGQWYEAERYPILKNLGKWCVTYDFRLAKNNGSVLLESCELSLLGVLQQYTGSSELLPALNGNFNFTLNNSYAPYIAYSVVSYDPSSYMVLYGGTDIGVGCLENVFILTRVNFPPQSVLDKAHAVLADSLDVSQLAKTRHEGCIYDD